MAQGAAQRAVRARDSVKRPVCLLVVDAPAAMGAGSVWCREGQVTMRTERSLVSMSANASAHGQWVGRWTVSLRAELRTALEAGRGRDVRFSVGSVEVDLAVEIVKKGRRRGFGQGA